VKWTRTFVLVPMISQDLETLKAVVTAPLLVAWLGSSTRKSTVMYALLFERAICGKAICRATGSYHQWRWSKCVSGNPTSAPWSSICRGHCARLNSKRQTVGLSIVRTSNSLLRWILADDYVWVKRHFATPQKATLKKKGRGLRNAVAKVCLFHSSRSEHKCVLPLDAMLTNSGAPRLCNNVTRSPKQATIDYWNR